MDLGSKTIRRLFVFFCILMGVLFEVLITTPRPVFAATGINQTVNFQGRLLNSAGATVPDGFYNIEFKIYQDGDGQSTGDSTGSPSGSLKWTEDYLNNTTQGVKVVNGFLSVNLGSVNPFGSSVDWNQNTLWLSMNIGGTAGACTPFSSCSPDGEMVPMQPLTSAIYALNANELGGQTAAAFGQLASNQTWTGYNIYKNASNSASAFQIQDAGSNVLFNVDTTVDKVSINNSGATGTVQIGNTTGAV